MEGQPLEQLRVKIQDADGKALKQKCVLMNFAAL